jgi:hypothetical protein
MKSIGMDIHIKQTYFYVLDSEGKHKDEIEFDEQRTKAVTMKPKTKPEKLRDAA